MARPVNPCEHDSFYLFGAIHDVACVLVIIVLTSFFVAQEAGNKRAEADP